MVLPWLRFTDDIHIVKNTLFHKIYILQRKSKISESFCVIKCIRDYRLFQNYGQNYLPLSISTVCFVNLTSPLNLVKECSTGIYNDDHWDINKQKLPPLIVTRIDLPKAISYLEEESHQIFVFVRDNVLNNDNLYTLLSKTIYNICKKSDKEDKLKLQHPLCTQILTTRCLWTFVKFIWKTGLIMNN